MSTAVFAQNNNVVKPEVFQTGIKQSGVQVFDVRTLAEYSAGHLPHAMQADYAREEEFNERIKYLNKEQPVYIYCLSGPRAAGAAKQMREKGFTNVVELDGGIAAWKGAGLAVEGGNNLPQLTLIDFTGKISEGDVLIEIGADWCPPCQKMEPAVAAYLKAHAGIKLLKVDGSKDTNVIKTLGATTLPTFILYKEGQEVWRKTGVVELN
ncbi:rhodanese-like domain-containing protein [Chitinophaga sancti]|nr:rhodanese-like domain-containing protein [Chitinophaga sancti]WQD65675.1 rhodanese-like domain-containing protein [Chitinophaga sancti]WQG88703.1 rhodanese-like domain-containing protein [Chitinophaga sancti]